MNYPVNVTSNLLHLEMRELLVSQFYDFISFVVRQSIDWYLTDSTAFVYF